MNAPAGHAAIELGLKGINSTVNHREASAETALAYAAMQIRLGRADAILAGGGDTISPFFFTVLERFKALSPQDAGEEMARPLDRQRNGPVIGEGATLLCLESLESAHARGATIHGEIAGWGMASSPAPANDWPDDPAGLILAMQKAMRMAAVDPTDVQAVFAAASGGIRSDRLEARALDHVFEQRPRPVVTAVKGALGENFASGGVRTAALAMAMQEDKVPPTLGVASPILSLDVVTSGARQMDVGCGLVNGCASSGTFVSLVLRKI
jgi:3-oxoacyl-[acyl-carrier-protein] synthase II